MITALKKLLNFLERHEGIIILLLIAVVLRLPSLHEPYWYGDEGIYLVLGQALRKGLVWYREIHDNKPPMLYLTAALAGNVMWFRFITLVANLFNIVVIWQLAKKFFVSTRLVFGATLLFVLATCLPPLEGNIANAEIFMILPVSLGMLILLTKTDLKHFFGAGVLFSLGFLFKVPSAFDFAAAGFWLVFFGGLAWRSDRKAILKLVVLVSGFLLPLGLTLIYYFLTGAGEQYLNAAFLQNVGYLSSWRTGSISRSGGSTQSGLMVRGIILLVALVIIWLMTRGKKPLRRLLPVWFAFALFGALLSERPYPHYLIQIAPPAVLLLPSLFTKQLRTYIALTLGLAAVTTAAIFYYKFYFYPTVGYYRSFISYMTGRSTKEEYYAQFDWRVNRNYQIAAYIKERTVPTDRIFVWGDEPFIYALADRLPVGRYTVAYHVVDFGGQAETMADLEREKPLYIVLEESEKREFRELIAYTLVNYLPVQRFEDATIYLRLNGR